MPIPPASFSAAALNMKSAGVMTSILGRPGKVLVLFGGGSAHRTGILGAVEDSLQESGFAVIEMGRCAAQSPDGICPRHD